MVLARRSLLKMIGLGPMVVVPAPQAAGGVASRVDGGATISINGIPFARPVGGIDPTPGQNWQTVAARVEAERATYAEAALLVPDRVRFIPGNYAAGVLPSHVVIPSEAPFLALDDVGGGP